MHQVWELGKTAIDKQVLTFTSSEAKMPDLTAMTPEKRTAEHDKRRALVPASMHGAIKSFFDKTREIWNPNDLVIGDVAKYCEGHAHMWGEVRVAKEAKDAGDWGGAGTAQFFDDGDSLFGVTVGNSDAYVKVGFAESEFGHVDVDPSPPEATVRALTARVEASVAEVEPVVSSSFGHLIRLLKIEAAITKLDKADAEKEERENRLRRGKDGGYGATEEQRKESDDADAIEDANNVVVDDAAAAGPIDLGRSVVDRVMSKQEGGRRPTNRHTRVDNFMLATGTQSRHIFTRQRVGIYATVFDYLGYQHSCVVPKNHKLVVRTSAEFLNRVISNGEIIIRDHFKPLCDRVFPPADMGGVAGVSQ